MKEMRSSVTTAEVGFRRRGDQWSEKQFMKTQIIKTSIGCLHLLIVHFAAYGDEVIQMPYARQDDNCFLVPTVESPYQAEKTDIRVFLPSRFTEGKR